jgi:hypothetical protein
MQPTNGCANEYFGGIRELKIGKAVVLQNLSPAL